MAQRIYFSDVGEIDLWKRNLGRDSRFLENAVHLLGFFLWDATPDLAQTTWEWPEPWQPVDEMGWAHALVNDLKALESYEARQKPHMERQFYGN